MTTCPLRLPRWWPALAAIVGFMTLGCSDDGLGKRYTVRGTITYNGEPVPAGNIYFILDDPQSGRAASGPISNGRYTLSTLGGDDGALPGSYKVRIMALEVDQSQVLAGTDKGAAGRQDDVIDATHSAKKLIPAKYELETTSGLTATVEERSNTINFDLTD